MTRGRYRNVAVVADDTGLADPADVLTGILQRPASGATAHATRARLHAQHDVPVIERPRQPEELSPRRLVPPRRPPAVGIGL
jgi:hypothetical protein